MLSPIVKFLIPLTLVLPLALTACGNGFGQLRPTATPTITSTATLTYTPTSTATFIPTPTRTPTPTPDFPSVLTAIAPLARRQGIPEAAAYLPDQPGPHRVVLFTESGLPHQWNDSLPVEWLPSSAHETELVLVVGEEKEIALGSAYYKGGNRAVRVFRYRFEMNVVIREATTGRNLKIAKVSGSEPGEFPTALAAGITRLDGEHITEGLFRGWLMCNIVMPELCKTPPLKGHFGPVMNVAFSSDGQTLVSGPEFDKVFLWNVADGTLVRTLDLFDFPPEAVERAVYTVNNSPGAQLAPDGKTWAMGEEPGTIAIGDPAVASSILTLEGHQGPVRSVAFSADGQILASGSEDQTVRLWQVEGGSPLLTLKGHAGPVNQVAFSPNGEILASGSDDKTVRVWRASDGSLVLVLEGHSGAVKSIAFSPDGKLLASASDDESVRVWQVADGSLLLSIWGHAGPVTSVAFSPDGQTLASASEDGTVGLWAIP